MTYQWPEDRRNDYTRFPFNHDLHPLDRHKIEIDYERKLRREFMGRNSVVLAHEARPWTWVPRDDAGNRDHTKAKNMLRYVMAVEIDRWVREPDPEPTWLQRLYFVAFKTPLPESEVPPRIIQHYDVTALQYDLFCKIRRTL